MDWVIPLISLAAMEIVLGIDNVIFIAILVAKLPESQQKFARQLGLILALGSRLALLFSISWIMSLENSLFNLADWGIKPEWLTFLEHPEKSLNITGKDLVLLIGGLFLIGKSVNEIHHKLEGHEDAAGGSVKASFSMVIIQIILIDVVFSLDSVITAVGMVKEIWVMVVAMIMAVGVMLIFAGPISNFVAKHPTIKILALAFLILIGVMLMVEGTGGHVNKGYIYFAMAFSLLVELINIRMRVKTTPVKLNEPPPVTE